jgi:TonB-linked SusC/RagA family outer membrane protein
MLPTSAVSARHMPSRGTNPKLGRLLMGRWRLLLVLGLFVATRAQAQQGTGRVTGTVVNEGRPLPNANVLIVGSNPVRGSQTDATGRYTITGVPAGPQQVQARLIGFAPQTKAVTVVADQSVTVDFALISQAVQLQGIVTVGYGTQSRREVTGAISTVDSSVFKQVVAANPLDAIKGRIPGVDITSGSFEPGAASNIRIRGVRSITASNNPLYVVDGVPITGDLRDIDQNSIDRVEVLKDAAATAVYGSRGANGVLLITTKRGSLTGKTEFTLNSTYGVSKIRREVDMMDATEFANFRRESYRSAGAAACANYFASAAATTACDLVALDPTMRANLAAGVNTNWQDLLLRTGNLNNTQIGFSGGNAETRFRAGFGYLGQTGIAIVQDYNARTGSFNISHTHGPLDLQLGVQGTRNHRDAGRGAVMWDEALFNSPLGRNVDSTGTSIFLPTEDGLLVNPVMAARAYQRQIDRTNILGTLTGSLRLMDGLRAHVNFGPQYTNQTDGRFIGVFTRQKRGVGAPDATELRNQDQNYTLSNFLDYDKLLGGEKHHIQATALYEVASFKTVFDSAAALALPFDNQLWYNLGTGSTPTLNGAYTKRALQSYMGRVNYTYHDRYTLSATGRYDGSSVLAEGHKFAFFPAASLGWQIGDESFMQGVPGLSDLKLRVSYGRVGNSAINAYQTLGLLNRTWAANNGTYVVGFGPGAIPNPNLRWETTDKYNLGFDFGFIDQRIAGQVDAYRENTHDLLLARALPQTSGYSSVLENVGATKNTGIEFAITTQNLQKWHGLGWTTDFNISTNKNEIVALSSGLTSDVGNARFVGQPINVNYDYKYVGLWQMADSALARTACGCKPGDIRVADLNSDGKINSDDRTIIGRQYNFPRWQGSLNNRFTFGKVDLSVLAMARQGFLINDAFTSAYNSLAGRFNNVATNYWTPENQTGTEPRPSTNGLGNFAGSRNYKDGSFVRIRDITLGYALSNALAGRIGASRARLYIRAQDPFIFTKYKGWDPEAGFSAGDGASGASQIDQGGPAFRTALFGLDITF